jgi:hypothetical protein
VPRNDLIQLRSDTAANWVSVNPTLAVGETGFETDTGKLKVGTGSSDWNSLIYVTDASDLAGIIPSARISGSYTGITGLGTLTSLTIDGPSSPSFTLGDSAFAGYSGVVGDKGYLLVSDSVGDPAIYLRSSGAGSVYIGQANSNTLQVGNGTVTVAGTMNATTFSGGEILATTVLGSTNRGVGIKADPTNTQAILQFTNNAVSAQWSSIVATNGLLTATTSVAVSGNVTVPNTTLNYFGSANGSNVFYPMDTSNNMFLKVGTGNFYVNAPNHYFRNSSSAIIMSLASSGAVTVNGTLTATTFSGSGSSLTSLPADQLTGPVASARISGSYTGITGLGTLTSLSVSGALNAYSISGNSNVDGTGNASYHPSGIYSKGTNWLYGNVFLNGNDIGDTSSTVTGAGQIYANGWFRSWGDSGWYNQSYGGGIWMTDTSFVRIYNGKIFYAVGGIWSIDTGTASTTGFQYLLRGTLYGNYAPFTSMREAKRNIETIPNSGLLIDQLNPVTFQEKITDTDDEISTAWKDADLEYGFIADEVAQVGTGHLAQYESMDDGTLKPVGWSFHGVVSVLVAEVKDLRKRLQQLEESNV